MENGIMRIVMCDVRIRICWSGSAGINDFSPTVIRPGNLTNWKIETLSVAEKCDSIIYYGTVSFFALSADSVCHPTYFQGQYILSERGRVRHFFLLTVYSKHEGHYAAMSWNSQCNTKLGFRMTWLQRRLLVTLQKIDLIDFFLGKDKKWQHSNVLDFFLLPL